jgi:hypothetical protein
MSVSKKNMRQYLLILSCILCTVFFIEPARSQDFLACKEDLKKSLSVIEKIYSDTTKHVYAHYKVSNMNNLDKKIETEEVKFYLKGETCVISSSQSSYYSDKRYSFLVVPSQRSVFRLDVQDLKTKGFEKMAVLSKQILDSSTVISCKKLENGYTKIVVVFPSKYTAVSKISKGEYILDPAAHLVKECKLYFLENARFIYMEFTFISVTNDVKLPFEGTSVRNLFLDKNNKLVGTYQGFQYKDVRNKK